MKTAPVTAEIRILFHLIELDDHISRIQADLQNILQTVVLDEIPVAWDIGSVLYNLRFQLDTYVAEREEYVTRFRDIRNEPR